MSASSVLPPGFERLAHDVRNALNGVAVNLEVARSRLADGALDSERVLPFLDNAAQQLDAAVRLHKQFSELAVAAMQHPGPSSG